MPCSHLLHIHTWTLTIVVEVLLAGNPVCRFPMFTNTRVYRTTMLVHRRNRLLERNERPTFVSLDEKMIDFPTNNIRNDVRSHVWWLKSTRERGGAGVEKGKGAIRSSGGESVLESWKKRRLGTVQSLKAVRVSPERELDQLVLDQPPEC